MYRIGFIGVPSTGKTTLARALSANSYKVPEFARAELVSEYARRFIVEYGTDVTLMDQFRIIKKQCEWEDRVPFESTDLVITDSPIHISFMYSLDRCDGSKKDVLYLNDIFKILNKLTYPPRYDVIFHLPWDAFKPVDDGVRASFQLEDEWRKKADIRLRSVFEVFPPKHFHSVQAQSTEDRIEECLKFMKLKLLSETA